MPTIITEKAIVVCNKRLLLLRRVLSSKAFGGHFDLPGGKLEKKEEIREEDIGKFADFHQKLIDGSIEWPKRLAGIVREITEETGVNIFKSNDLKEIEFSFLNQRKFTEPGMFESSLFVYWWIVRLKDKKKDPEITLNEEHDEYLWLCPDTNFHGKITPEASLAIRILRG